MKMSDLDYKQIDFLQIEKHVDSAIFDLRRIQSAGKYPKKVCTPAMYGANMLNAQKNIISSARHEVGRLEQESEELREALNTVIKVLKGETEFSSDEIDHYKIEQLLNK